MLSAAAAEEAVITLAEKRLLLVEACHKAHGTPMPTQKNFCVALVQRIFQDALGKSIAARAGAASSAAGAAVVPA